MAILTSALLGLIFAFCARTQFESGLGPWGRELVAVLSFETIIGWPVALYFCLAHPAWSWMYLVDPARLPVGTTVLLLSGLGVSLVAGYLAGWGLVRANREPVLYGALPSLALLGIGIGIAFRNRLLRVGSFAEFQAGHAAFIGRTKLAWALGACTIGIVLAVALVGFTLWEQGRRYRP